MGLSKRAFVLALILHLLIGGALLKLLYLMQFYSVPAGRIEVHGAYVVNHVTAQSLSPLKPIIKTGQAKNGVLPLSIPHPTLANPDVNAQVLKATPTTESKTTKTITPATTQANLQPTTPNAPNVELLAPTEIQQLLQLISLKIQQHLAYPRLAQTETEQGQSVLQFELTPQGDLQNVQVVQSSGMAVLDQAALYAQV